MAHEDEGHYAEKHQGVEMNPEISEKIKTLAEEGTLPCASAHRAAADLGVDPLEIGVQADLMELRITKCQMGLFGYGKGTKKIDPSIEVEDRLWNKLETTSVDGRISCSQCWNIAREFKKKRLDIGSACEKLDLRIKPCQLGAF